MNDALITSMHPYNDHRGVVFQTYTYIISSSSSSYLFAQNSTRHLKQSQADNELDGQGSNGALTAT